jgi:hypothetical protein
MFTKATGSTLRFCLLVLGVIIYCSTTTNLEAQGKTLVDTGFRPKPSGFSFPNWGGDEHPSSDLTPNDLVQLFGERVCVRWQGDNCVPTPGAALWLEQQNSAMKGGRCEGMAALSSAFHVNSENPSEYGASPTFALTPANRGLLTTISTYWVTQNLEPVSQNTRATKEWSLQQIVDFLVDNLGSKKDYATLGIYSEDSGHAITPYKIDEISPKVYRVYVYDNNHPGEEKYVEIDAGKNRWKYALAAINPSEDPSPWEGGIGSMDVTLLSSRYAPLACPFCGEHAPPRAPKPANGPQGPRAPSVNSDLITLETPARCSQIVVIGKKDKKQFSVGKVKKNEIKGASMSQRRGSRGCTVKLPSTQQYDFQLVDDGRPSRAPMTDVFMYVPGSVYSISNVALSQGSTQTLSIGTNTFTFQAGGSQKPTLRIANECGDSLGYYEIKDLTLNDGYAFNVEEGADGKLAFSDNDPNLDSYDLKVEDIEEDGTKSYEYEDVDVTDEGKAVIDVDDPNGVDLDSDSDGDGTVDEEDTDDDNDGALDTKDTDDDGDGTQDDKEEADADHDGIADTVDSDDDNDGTADTADSDDDGDGTADDQEADDADHDGISDSADTDDDNDGTADTADSDDDGDGTADDQEADDADHDGITDAADTDDDNDGTADTADTDDDNDGIADTQDNDNEADTAADNDTDDGSDDNGASEDDPSAGNDAADNADADSTDDGGDQE